jgi:NhaA family Na+:H+ antiporter
MSPSERRTTPGTPRAKSATRRLFERANASTERTLVDLLRNERVGGVLMLVATAAALAWANSSWSGRYEQLREYVPYHAPDATVIGLPFHLELTLQQWVTDGILAIFFFVVGLELKREIVAGQLRQLSRAVLPIAGAIGGMIVPALVYLGVNSAMDGGTSAGWAIPTATDIAFALAVLSIVGRRLPSAVRAFLLTLAVVDDLFAILIIAVFFSGGIEFGWLAVALVPLAAVGYTTRRGHIRAWAFIPLAAATWLAVEQAGIHATIAGVALGLVVPAARHGRETVGAAERLEHLWGPVSAGFAIPVFAFFAAGVSLGGGALGDAIADPAAVGVAAGLAIGKPLGVMAAAFAVAALTRARLNPGLSWWDVAAIAGISGIGFTVSLLIGDLAFASSANRIDHVTVAVLAASAVAALVGGAMLAWRDRHHASRAG